MNSCDRPDRLSRWLRCARATALLALLGLLVITYSRGQNAGSEPAKEPNKEETPKTPSKPAVEPGAVEVRCTDNSILKLIIRDDKLPLTTPYGKLTIPVAEIQRIEFATRIAEEDAKRIEAAIAKLDHTQFKEREAATAELMALGIKAYPALLKAAKHTDAEVVRRAEELLAKIRDSVPEDQLVVRERDVIQTEHSKIAGHIDLKTLKVSTAQFGDQQLKLADVCFARSLGLEPEPDTSNVAEGPADLQSLQNQIGKTFRFKVTGAVNGTVWGTGTYTTDSPLATVAVHAGVLKQGQTGVVKVTIVVPPAAFQGTARNGVSSADYGPFPGAYMVSR
jgi:hypothetical protein